MRFYNVMQAAAYIGCDPKTVRRMLKRGQLTAERTSRGWLAIPGGQVEYAKIKWEEERDQFVTGQHRASLGKDTRDSLDMDTGASLDSIGKLEERIDELEALVRKHEQRIAWLEDKVTAMRVNGAVDAVRQAVPMSTDEKTVPQSKPQISTTQPSTIPMIGTESRNRPVPGHLPPGTLHWRDFAEQIGIKETVLEGIIRRGVGGEHLERIEIPTAKPGDTAKYFDPEQQERARELLRKHRRIE